MTIIDRTAPGIRVVALTDEHAAGGEPVDLVGRVLSFSFEDSETKADRAELSLDNFDLSLFERPELAGGALLEVAWGYPGSMAPPRRVVVKRLKGFNPLTVEGEALSVQLDREAKTRRFAHKTRAEVARAIAAEHGYSGAFLDVEDGGEQLESVQQAGETDARFLRRLAQGAGVEFYVDDAGFHWRGRRAGDAPVRVFTWYADQAQGDVISLQMESDLTPRAGRVTVRGRDPMARATVQASSTAGSADRTTLGDVIEVVDPETGRTRLEQRSATASVRPAAAPTAGRAQAEADARFRRAEQETIRLSMQVVGEPTLRAKTVVELRGVGAFLSGKYYVTDVKHSISSSGYTCDLKLTKDGVGRRARPDAQPQGGTPNRQAPREAQEVIEHVDPETGRTSLRYRGGAPGATDPEGRR